jgi:adenosylcobinamide-GDP ribazoletransferase
MIQEFLLALTFLTRISVAKTRDFSGLTLAGSVWAFPVIGILTGGIAALGYAVAVTLGLTHSIAAWIAIAGLLLLTGGLHEDGLADMADGMAHGRDREQKLAIMRDSRIGSYGVLALIAVLAIRANAMAAFDANATMVCAFVAAAAASRALMVIAMHTLPPARMDGLAAHAGKPTLRRTAIAACIAITLLITAHALLSGLAVLAASYVVIRHIALTRLGGITGDVLGALQQVSEAALLAVFSLNG